MGSKNSEHPKDPSSDIPKENNEDRKRRLAEADAKLRVAQSRQEMNIFIENASSILMELGLDMDSIERDDLGNVTREGVETILRYLKAHGEKSPFASIILGELLHIKDRKAD